MKPFVHPPRTTQLSKAQMAAVLWILHLRGPVKSKSGRGASELLKRLQDAGSAMSINTLNRIVNSLAPTDRISKKSEYPYHYINRVVNGRRTSLIELIVDPHEVPFPPNPFKDDPRFTPTKPQEEPPAPVPVQARLRGETVQPETFARQGLFESLQPKKPVDEEPEETQVEMQVEEPVEEPATNAVEPYVPPTAEGTGDIGALEPLELPAKVRTNGTADDDTDDDDLFSLPDDLLADLNGADSRRSTELIAKAVGLLSEAMAAVQTEQIDLVTLGIGQEIDRRFGQYQALQDRLAQREDQLRHVVGQYERVVEIAKQLRRKNAALERRLAQSVSA